MSRRKKSRSKGGKPVVKLRRAVLTVEELEIARGHDGLMRGRPEPVIVVGVFAGSAQAMKLVARTALHFTVTSKAPTIARCAGEDGRVEPLSARVPREESVVALLLAIEADSSDDVRELFAALETPDVWRGWQVDEEVPAPRELRSFAPPPLTSPASAIASNVLLRGRDLRDTLVNDDFVGAALLRFPPHGAEGVTLRAHFLAPDGRNDWTALVWVH